MSSDHDWAYDVENRADGGQVPRRLLGPEISAQRFSGALQPLMAQHYPAAEGPARLRTLMQTHEYAPEDFAD